MKKDEEAKKMLSLAKEYFEGEAELESVLLLLPRLENKLDIQNLRAANHMTDEQYEKLSIGPHTLPSISKIIQGRGLYRVEALEVFP